MTYTLDEPRFGETPIRVRWHEEINSGPSAAEVSGVIPVGSSGPATLSLTALNCGGQIDMTAVFTSNGDSRGRWVGPSSRSRPVPRLRRQRRQARPRRGHDHADDRPVVFDIDPGARDDVNRVHLSGGRVGGDGDQPTGWRTSGDRWQRDEPGRSWCRRVGDRRGARRGDPPRAAVPPFGVAAGSSFTPHATRLWSGGPKGSEAPLPQQGQGRAPPFHSCSRVSACRVIPTRGSPCGSADPVHG